MKPTLVALLVSILALFLTSCGTEHQVFETTTNRPVSNSAPADTPTPIGSDDAEPTPEEALPTDFVPSNPDTWVNSGILPALNNPLSPQDDSGELASLPPEAEEAASTVTNQTSPDVLGDELATKEKSELEQRLAESEALNAKLTEENGRLMGAAYQTELTMNDLTKELAAKQRALAEIKQSQKEESANALFLTIVQPNTEEVAADTDAEFLVAVLSVPAQNNQKLGEFANVGTVKSNRSGILTIRDKMADKEGVVAEYKLNEGSDCVMSVPQDLSPLLGVPKDWGITFKPDEREFSGTATVIDFSLAGAELKNSSAPLLVSDTVGRWSLQSTELVALVPPVQKSEKKVVSQWWQHKYMKITLTALVLIGILLIYITSKISKQNQHLNGDANHGETHDYVGSKPNLGVADPSGANFPYTGPFTVVGEEDDDIGHIDEPEPPVKKPTRLPPPRVPTPEGLKPVPSGNPHHTVKWEQIIKTG